MSVDAASTAVDTAPAAPPPVGDTPSTPSAPSLPELNAEKPSIRDGIEKGLKALQSERTRDEAGRFAVEAKDKPAPAQTPAAQPVVAKPAVVERPATMPKAWGADKAALWTGLSPEVAAYMTERENAMEAFHAKHAGLAQWQQIAESNGNTLPQVLERVHQVETAMSTDPARGFLAAAEMVGLDRHATVGALVGALRSLGVDMGGAQPAPANGATPPNGQLPDVAAMVREAVNSAVGPILTDARQRALGEAEGKVKAFFADPANKYANELQTEISGELRAMRALGQQPDLAKAYDRALRSRPDLHEKLVTERIEEKQKAAEAARTQELEKSRSASRSVAGSPSTANGRSSADKPATMREQLTHAVRAIAGRA